MKIICILAVLAFLLYSFYIVWRTIYLTKNGVLAEAKMTNVFGIARIQFLTEKEKHIQKYCFTMSAKFDEEYDGPQQMQILYNPFYPQMLVFNTYEDLYLRPGIQAFISIIGSALYFLL